MWSTQHYEESHAIRGFIDEGRAEEFVSKLEQIQALETEIWGEENSDISYIILPLDLDVVGWRDDEESAADEPTIEYSSQTEGLTKW